MLQDYRFDTVPELVGQELGITPWMTVDQAQIDQFAACTGDHQWIHVDVERCKTDSPYGRPIAHGFLTLSLLARLLMDLGLVPPDVKQAINAGVNNVRFKTPVRAGARVRARARIASAERKGEGRIIATASAVLEVEGEKDPALGADVTVMLFRGEPA
ncbi:MAG TPA: MaoC/PaaZ C-terminal domain-containing protein [Solimonas sp.]|nr:MaoC/PaaZ C-terminal domain-containing protein [Solimonas sp.]